MNPAIDDYLAKSKNWKKELSQLRMILLQTELTEELKWRQPTYTLNGKNICILGSFKTFCTLAFFKGALLKDKKNLLLKQGENTQSARIIKFTSVDEIIDMELIIKKYVQEAIEIEKTGLKLLKNSDETLELPEELLTVFNEDIKFKKAFEALSPGRQRGYKLFFTGAKQSATRLARIEKYKKRILKGFGINDCVCGLSKKMPGCDGSHKILGA